MGPGLSIVTSDPGDSKLYVDQQQETKERGDEIAK